MTIRRPILLTLCALLVGCVSEASTNGGMCIAPANPGGGWDLTCRATAEALSTQTPAMRPLRILNVPGEGGGVAFARVVRQAPGTDPVLVAASPSTLLGLAQNHYGSYTEKNVRWIAAVGAEPSVIAVRADAPWHTLAELVTAWRANPDAIAIGGGSVIGGQDHMKILLLARAAGVDVRRVKYLPLSGPVEAITSLQSGAIQVFPGDASEVRQQVTKRTLRILAVLGESRSPGVFAGVPTAREQGLDVTWIVWRGFYAPPGITDVAYQEWVTRLRAMSDTPEWKALLARNALTPFFVGGHDFETFVSEQITAYRTVSKEIGLIP
jgi:putative tricarboxylic transport membrane protein